MRHWKIVAVVCFAVMAVAFGCLILYPEGDQKKGVEPESMETDTGQPETVSETGEQESLSMLLSGFAGVIYEYDTNVRKFYEGAQVYMTEKAFQAFAPLAGEADVQPPEVRVQSRLLETKDYCLFVDDSHAEVIKESRFTLSAGENGSLLQYLKLSVVKENDAWLITDCYVIDTLEQ